MSKRLDHELRALDLGELHPPNAIGEMPPELVSRVERESALADPALAGHRDRARHRKQPPDLQQLPTPSDEAAELDREVARRRSLAPAGYRRTSPEK